MPMRIGRHLRNLLVKFSKNKVPLPSIDLHIKVLNPNLKSASALEIFDYQMEACRGFLRDSKAQGSKKKIKVIHGVGSGKLADAVSRIAKEEFGASYGESPYQEEVTQRGIDYRILNSLGLVTRFKKPILS